MAQFRETEYVELWGQSPTETFGVQTSEATRVLLVDWGSRKQAALDFLGYSVAVPYFNQDKKGGTDPGQCFYLSRVTPDFHPDYLRASDGQPYLFADSVTFEPYGMPLNEDDQPAYGTDELATVNDVGVAVYRKAKMTVHYSMRLYEILNDDEMPDNQGVPTESGLERYVEIQRHPTAEYLTLPLGVFKYAVAPGPGAEACPGAPGKIQSMNDLAFVWKQVPPLMVASSSVVSQFRAGDLLPAAFDYGPGRVNNAAIWGYPAGTLLCEPMEITPWRQCDGEMVFDVPFHFKLFKEGHNFLLKMPIAPATAAVYVEISVDGHVHTEPAKDGVHIYDSFDFASLFLGYDFSAGTDPQGAN